MHNNRRRSNIVKVHTSDNHMQGYDVTAFSMVYYLSRLGSNIHTSCSSGFLLITLPKKARGVGRSGMTAALVSLRRPEKAYHNISYTCYVINENYCTLVTFHDVVKTNLINRKSVHIL